MSQNLTQIPDIVLEDVAASVDKHEVVSGVSFAVPAGAKLALVGTNGAGKSTLLRAMAGINPPTKGKVLIGGCCISQFKPRQRAKTISFVSQEETPSADLTLAEMVSLGRLPHRPPWAINPDKEKQIVTDALNTVGLADRLNASCDHLSGGERRRAMIARGLAQRCPVLMLDEPTNHLDIAWTLRLLGTLASLDVTVIAAIHDLDVVLRHFDAVAVLHDHRLLAFGPPGQIITSELMAEAFKVEALQTPHPQTNQPHLLISKGKDNTDES